LAEFLDYEFEKSCFISKYFAYKALSQIWFTYGYYLQAETEIPYFGLKSGITFQTRKIEGLQIVI